MPFLLIFLASIVGSPHCAAMCGGFVALSGQSVKPVHSQAAYHLGRLCTYLTLGAIAGKLGTTINKLGLSLGFTEAATVLTGGLLLLGGLAMLCGRSPKIHRIFPLNHFFALHQKLLTRKSPHLYFPFSLGAFSTLLPCGWLYSYVIVAAGTGSIYWAMLTMFAFWAGTLPMLISIGSLSNLISSPLKRYAPILIALLMIGAGIFSLATHLGITPHAHSGMNEGCSMSHH